MKIEKRAVAYGLSSLLSMRMGLVAGEEPTHLITRCSDSYFATLNSNSVCSCELIGTGVQLCFGGEVEPGRNAICIEDLTGPKQFPICAYEYSVPTTCPTSSFTVPETSPLTICADSASRYSCGKELKNCSSIPNVGVSQCEDSERCRILSCKEGYRFRWKNGKEACVLPKPLFE